MEAAEERSYCPMCNAVFRTPFARCPLDGAKLAELDEDPLIGTVLDKRYQIEECIGEGGMGRVYRAKHVRMSRMYAIKILFGDHAGNTRMRSRFAREAEAVSRLNHTNVISVVDFGETEEGLLYLVMDLADGCSLADIVHEEAPLDPQRCFAIMHQMLKGLAHAHGNSLVHRDFKCENVIMVTEEGKEVPKIVDFGICMIVEDHPSSTMLTSSGMIMGTPAVMAPEQASGDTVDSRTDLFSLGIVGYQMLSGQLPFDGTPMEMARKNLYDTIPTIYERSGIVVSPQIQAIISKLTEKRPENRYQTANEVIADIAALSFQQSPAIPTPPTPHTPPGSFPQSSVQPRNILSSTTPASLPGITPHAPALQQTPPPQQTPAPFTPAPSSSTEAVRPLPLQTEWARLDSFGQPEEQRKSKKGLIIAISAVFAVGLLVLVATSGGAEKDPPSSLAGVTMDAAPLEKTTDPAPVVPTTKNSLPLDAGVPTSLPTQPPDNTVRPPDKEPVADPPPTTKDHGTKKQPRKAKPVLSAQEKSKQAIAANLRLYAKAGSLLNSLRRERGSSAASDLSRRYGSIPRTELGRNPAVQKKYSQLLKKLIRDIKQRRR